MLDKVTKAIVLLTLMCCLAGVLTVSAYLYGLDAPVPDLQVLRARYVVTGVGVVAGLAIAAGYEFALWGALCTGKEPWASYRKLTVGGLLAVGFLTGWVVWAVVLAFDDPASLWSRWDSALLVWLVTLGAAIFAAVGLGLYYVRKKPSEWVFVGLAASGVVSALLFAGQGYKQIPDQFGGGRPSRRNFSSSTTTSTKRARSGFNSLQATPSCHGRSPSCSTAMRLSL